MKTMRALCISLISVLSSVLLFFSTEVIAETVVIDFNNADAGGLYKKDYFEDGFRMEHISGHYDIWPDRGTNNTQYLGLDIIENENISMVRLSSTTGALFNLISLETISLSKHDGLTVSSSAGGGVFFETNEVQSFNGPEWKDLSWVLISSRVGIGGPGLDTIVISKVPIPATLWLFGSGLIGLAGCRKIGIIRSRLRCSTAREGSV